MDGNAEPLQPIFTAHLFPKLEGMLIELLQSLTAEDWEKQTLAPKWRVKDVAAHLLDTQLRKLFASRDRRAPESPKITSHADLVTLVNSLNAAGVRKYRVLSPHELISRMELASTESAEYHQSLDPFAPAMFSVSWAGEQESANWFDTAREFTERWHHQQQIRIAVDKPGIMTREFLLSGPRLFHARTALRLPDRAGKTRNAGAIQYRRRVRWKLGIYSGAAIRGDWFLPQSEKQFQRQPSRRKLPGASSPKESLRKPRSPRCT